MLPTLASVSLSSISFQDKSRNSLVIQKPSSSGGISSTLKKYENNKS